MRKFRYKDGWICLFLFILTMVFCWLFVLRSGIFGSKVDWISQHSVLPDYFRKQFYETGELFPEFALNIGGGQNIYHFAYYGLLSPVVLLSYLLPFVKMSDYMMAAQIFCLATSVMLFYVWLRRRQIPQHIAFGVSILFMLSGPMIFHSYNQIMFVNYMPFLCMGFLGVDRYFEQRCRGLLTAGIFLMIMTSFYFSIGGMLVLVLYGIYRYFEVCSEEEKRISFTGFITEGFRFLVPFILAVFLSGVLLVPAAMALTGRQGSITGIKLAELLLPQASVDRFFYTPYGIGLTTFSITTLSAMLFFRRLHERLLAWSCAVVLIFPVFAWLLNGGLYIRDKVMIPFLPLLCYIMAYYLRTAENAGTKCAKMECGVRTVPAIRSRWKNMRTKADSSLSCLPYLAPVFLIFAGRKTGDVGKYWKLVLAESMLMLLCFFLFRTIPWCKNAFMLILPSVLFLVIFGGVLHTRADRAVDKDFYEAVTDGDAGRLIKEVLKREEGLYRTEQLGNDTENAANLNRIQDMSQLVSSIYSSSYNEEYQNFREKTFEIEEPFRNFLMQSAVGNPVYQDFMGVKYVLRRTSSDSSGSGHADGTLKEYSDQKEEINYRLAGKKGAWELYENTDALPVAFATDKVISEKEYRNLSFPYNQLALSEYAIVKNESAAYVQNEKNIVKAINIDFPEKISATENKTIMFPVMKEGAGKEKEEKNSKETVLFLQFQIKNLKPSEDVTVWVEGTRNKLTSRSHFYYNNNTTFTYAISVEKAQKEIEVKFGKGRYKISDVKCFLSDSTGPGKDELCQSELKPDKTKTKGKTIAGTIDVKKDGYFISTIPYDENFEIFVDGKEIRKEKINTAFLGFKIKQGRHEIEIIYHAPGLLAGKLLSLTGFLLAVGMLCRKLKRG